MGIYRTGAAPLFPSGADLHPEGLGTTSENEAEQETPIIRHAQFRVGEVVRHKHFPFRGVVFDVDAVFGNTEEWWLSIPEHIRPQKDQPFYHLYAENAEQEYVAYVSEQNLERDTSNEPVRHPKVLEALQEDAAGAWRLPPSHLN